MWGYVRTCCVEVDECGCACCIEMDECGCACCIEMDECGLRQPSWLVKNSFISFAPQVRTVLYSTYTFPAPSQRNPASAFCQIGGRKKLDAVQRSAA